MVLDASAKYRPFELKVSPRNMERDRMMLEMVKGCWRRSNIAPPRRPKQFSTHTINDDEHKFRRR
jgi:hypothetical protein